MDLKKTQVTYMATKAIYEAALAAEDWDKVEEVEDDYILAENDLVKWGLDQAVKLGQFTQEAADQLLGDMSLEQYHKMAEMTARVAL